jgi:hypothetical protein
MQFLTTESTDFCRWQATAMVRLLPGEDPQRAGQVRCKRLVRSNANDWSVLMQTGSQVECNSPKEKRVTLQLPLSPGPPC